MLNLFYITNSPEVAAIAERYGVDRIWVDLERLGKDARQPGTTTVKSNHAIADVARIKPILKSAELLVRIDPWNPKSPAQIEAVLEAGADILMLPMWKTIDEVAHFLAAVGGRAKTVPLLETKEAVACLADALKLEFDEIHIGLNDLSRSYQMRFLFEPLANGMVEALCKQCGARGIPYGFGGIARLGFGHVPSENVIMEHYRLGSTRAILSRSFCDINLCTDLEEIEKRFSVHMKLLRDYEAVCQAADEKTLLANQRRVQELVALNCRRIEEERCHEA